ncbi:hypothetical protein [Flammeovirga sp. OC4]|uniref:hypothetical protein n=1 Tax=Flammeovirga sp. OC4 TaxID=1382345 RepID=UPI0005C6FDA4|nr:hypothetical protein [Flammeovirga sp. OC4]
MGLSTRATKYLQSLDRNLEWTSNEDQTKVYLEKQNIRHFEEFLKYQTLYSGYKLTIQDQPLSSFSVSLFSRDQIINNESLDLEKIGDKFIEICGEHMTAQFTFFITERGEICTLDNNGLPNILHNSFEKMLEEYALKNEIYNWPSNPYYFTIKNIEGLMKIMNDKFQTIPECSDEYSTWWKNDELIAVKGRTLDGPDSFFHVYGLTRNQCDGLIEKLKDQGILK